MKERPILFGRPMVRALLDGRKTQTRRAVKPQPVEIVDGIPYRNVFEGDGIRSIRRVVGTKVHRCPYGNPGDRLWVRETWCDAWAATDGIHYRADGDLPIEMFDAGCKWRPSIFLPRWRSRITLEVTGVRLQRLHEISELDARREGMLCVPGGWASDEGQPTSINARRAFEDLWNAINGSWNDCWVWVIEFQRL